MLKRQTTGSVVCVSCGYLVGVRDERCYNCGRRNPGLWGFAASVRRLGNDLGFTPFVIGLCVTMFVLTLLASGSNIMGSGSLFSILSPDGYVSLQFGASGAWAVFMGGRWWTVLSAVWLHGSLIHIVVNLLSLRSLAPAVAELYGPGRMVIVYTVAGIVGFLLSSVAMLTELPFAGSGYTLGASGSIFGLLGALFYYGRRTGSSQMRAQLLQVLVMNLLIGFSFRGIDNYAHLGGLIGGWLTSLVLDPLKPERVDHMAIALVCLVLSVASLVVSYFTPLVLAL
jgi:rhomboid protease GluP